MSVSSFNRVTPIFRIFSEEKAKEFSAVMRPGEA